MVGRTFTPLMGNKLPHKFFVDFLEKEGLQLHGANDIKSLRGADGEPGPDKKRLEDLLKGLQEGEVRFVLRSSKE